MLRTETAFAVSKWIRSQENKLGRACVHHMRSKTTVVALLTVAALHLHSLRIIMASLWWRTAAGYDTNAKAWINNQREQGQRKHRHEGFVHTVCKSNSVSNPIFCLHYYFIRLQRTHVCCLDCIFFLFWNSESMNFGWIFVTCLNKAKDRMNKIKGMWWRSNISPWNAI